MNARRGVGGALPGLGGGDGGGDGGTPGGGGSRADADENDPSGSGLDGAVAAGGHDDDRRHVLGRAVSIQTKIKP